MDYARHVFEQPLYGDVNVYRVGDTLLDTGHMAPDCRAPVAEAVRDGPLAGVERVVLTHPDEDHMGGSQTIPSLSALPHTVYRGAESVVHNFNDHLRAGHAEQRRRTAGLDVDNEAVFERYFPTGDYAEGDIPVERVVDDGETVSLDEYDCEVVHTPGHEAHHMALHHAPSGTLFSGDLVTPSGNFNWSPVYSDVGAYERSLRRLQDLDPDVLLPGHGAPVTDPAARVADALEKAERTESGLREAVAAADGPVTAAALAREVFGADERTLRFMTINVTAFLDHLAAEGVLTVDYREDGVYAETR